MATVLDTKGPEARSGDNAEILPIEMKAGTPIVPAPAPDRPATGIAKQQQQQLYSRRALTAPTIASA